jgi:hypothetical protein
LTLAVVLTRAETRGGFPSGNTLLQRIAAWVTIGGVERLKLPLAEEPKE